MSQQGLQLYKEMETANDPRSIYSVVGIEERAQAFAKQILA